MGFCCFCFLLVYEAPIARFLFLEGCMVGLDVTEHLVVGTAEPLMPCTTRLEVWHVVITGVDNLGVAIKGNLTANIVVGPGGESTVQSNNRLDQRLAGTPNVELVGILIMAEVDAVGGLGDLL
jgi:hypothetical protein